MQNTPSKDIRWKQRFDNLQSAYGRLLQAATANEAAPVDVLYQMALVKAFEMSFELSWKVMKDYLDYSGIEVKSPREAIKQAYTNGVLQDGQLWIDMLEDRNLMTHTYDDAHAKVAVTHIRQRYMAGIAQLHQYLLDKLNPPKLGN
ncbi:MAG: HI0074 family nucleotidyltransferase substrate-binding subunit [Cytophagales bacterium]|nr:HI0074 family nucleotidyltransferase substrate-binding subunit [Cytophagales bacterium]